MAITRTQVLFYGKSTYVEADGCYSIAFFRPTTNGDLAVTSNVNIAGIPLEAGQTLSIEQNVGDQDFTSYEITFYPDNAIPTINELYVIKVMPVEASPNKGQPTYAQKSLNIGM
jgi:hypothetical protein